MFCDSMESIFRKQIARFSGRKNRYKKKMPKSISMRGDNVQAEHYGV
jgi:hypothetical protein